MTEYTEVTYKNLKDIIDNEYLSCNIGTYYLNLLQDRELRYNKAKHATRHCLFLNSYQFGRVKHPMNAKLYLVVAGYILRRLPYTTLGKKDFIPKNCELYILNNECSVHYNCYRVFWSNEDESWRLEIYDSMDNVSHDTSFLFPNNLVYKNILKFFNTVLEDFSIMKLKCYRMKSHQQKGTPDCLIFSLFNIEYLSTKAKKTTIKRKFYVTDASKRDVFLMSLLGLRVMSDRREMKDEQLSVIEDDMKQDIISVPDIIEPDIINLAEDDECISDNDNEGLKEEAKVELEGNNSIVVVPIDEDFTEKRHSIYQ